MSPTHGHPRRLAVALFWAALAAGAGACGDAAAVAEAPRAARDAPACRIVPANSGAAELLLALIGPDRLAAVPATVAGYADSSLRALALPTFQHYDAENVLCFEPDLVVTHTWQSSDATSFLETRGVPVLTLPDLGDFAGLLAVIETLGQRVQAPQAAAALTRELSARRERLLAVDRSAIRLVSYTNFGSGGWTAGSGSTADLLCELTGARNLASEHGREGHTSVDFETLITWNPDVFLVGASGERPEHSPSAEVLRNEASLQSIEALVRGRVIVLPAELYTTNSQRILDAAERLARELDDLF